MRKLYEPLRDKTNKLTVRPVWAGSLLSAWRKLGSLPTHWAHIKDSDKAVWMPRLIWVFAGRTVILLILSRGGSYTVKVLKIWTPDKCAVNTLKFEQGGFTIELCVQMANSLHCSPRQYTMRGWYLSESSVIPNLDFCTPILCSLTPTVWKNSIKFYGKMPNFSSLQFFEIQSLWGSCLKICCNADRVHTAEVTSSSYQVWLS